MKHKAYFIGSFIISAAYWMLYLEERDYQRYNENAINPVNLATISAEDSVRIRDSLDREKAEDNEFLKGWGKLEIGQKQQFVKSVLGSPIEAVELPSGRVQYKYKNASVTFEKDIGEREYKVVSWERSNY